MSGISQDLAKHADRKIEQAFYDGLALCETDVEKVQFCCAFMMAACARVSGALCGLGAIEQTGDDLVALETVIGMIREARQSGRA